MLTKGQTLLFPFPETFLFIITAIIIRDTIFILNICGKAFSFVEHSQPDLQA